jgi:AcrR family transcriptional regulator
VGPEPRETRSTRTRPALLAAMLSLLEEKPFDQLTIRDITTRAKVGYVTFFRHYPDKEALLHDLSAGEIRKLITMTMPLLYTVDSRAATTSLCAYLWEHRKLWSALLTGGAAAILKDEFVRQAQEQAVDQRTTLPGDLATVLPVASTIEVLAWWLKQADPPSTARMAEILDTLVITPILATGIPPEA